MARRCIFCEKMPVVANRVSHSNIKTKTRNFPNLQKVRLHLDGANQRAYVCTRCLRTGLAVKPKVHKLSRPKSPSDPAAGTPPVVAVDQP